MHEMKYFKDIFQLFVTNFLGDSYSVYSLILLKEKFKIFIIIIFVYFFVFMGNQ